MKMLQSISALILMTLLAGAYVVAHCIYVLLTPVRWFVREARFYMCPGKVVQPVASSRSDTMADDIKTESKNETLTNALDQIVEKEKTKPLSDWEKREVARHEMALKVDASAIAANASCKLSYEDNIRHHAESERMQAEFNAMVKEQHEAQERRHALWVVHAKNVEESNLQIAKANERIADVLTSFLNLPPTK
jgi:hypothetical protein